MDNKPFQNVCIKHENSTTKFWWGGGGLGGMAHMSDIPGLHDEQFENR